MKAHLENNAVDKKESILESTSLLKKRQKLILLADKSECGWKTVEEYSQHELTGSEDDGKKIRRSKERAKKTLKLLPPERHLGNFPQLSTRRFHVLLRRAIELLLGSVPKVVSVIFNTFLVAPPLIALRDQEIASLVINLVIGGLNATRSLVLDPLEVILTVDD